MPNKGYKQTEEHKANLSKAHKGMKKPWARPRWSEEDEKRRDKIKALLLEIHNQG